MPRKLKTKWILVIASLCYLHEAAAAPSLNPSNFTNSIDPGRTQKQIQRSSEFMSQPAFAPKTKLLEHAPAQEATKSRIHLILNQVIFKGNTVYSSAELEKIFAPSLHKTINLNDLEVMVHKVTTKYREDGYILSRAILPPQTIKNGVEIVQLIEGFVSSAAVKGDPGKAKALLEAYAKRAMQSKPLQFHNLQRYALLANDLPGYTVQTVLSPSPNVPAGADLTFVVMRKRGSAYVMYDDYGTRYLGPLETTIGGTLNSLIVPGDSNNAQVTVTPRPHEIQYASVSHVQPLGTSGMRWQLGASYAETRPSFVLDPLNIVGRNLSVYTDLSYPVIRDRDRNLSLHSTVNYQNINSTILEVPFYEDRIRSLDLGVNFDNIDHYHGINTASFDVTHGFAILGANIHENMSRPNGQARYTKLNAAFTRLQNLASRWTLFGSFHAQYSFESLLSTEQFGVGGPETGRGYDPSEIVGDRGISGKLELRRDAYPQYHYLQAIQYYAFYDAGMIWNIDTNSGVPRATVTSIGIGGRFTFTPELTGNLFIAKPMNHPVAVLALMGHNSTAARIFFQLSAVV